MTARKTYSNINLAPKDEFESSLTGKILRWALTTGRMIVVLTEFVVILAFVSRFKLDRDLNDINDMVTQKQAIVVSFEDTENQMRDLQSRLAIIKDMLTFNVNSDQSFSTLVNMTPRDIFYSAIEFSRDGWHLEGIAGSETSLATLLNQLQGLKVFNKVQLGTLEYNLRTGGVTFNISAFYPVAKAATKPTQQPLNANPTPSSANL